MIQQHCMLRKPWSLAFAAEPEELAALRRIARMHLRLWGLNHLDEAVELCVTEMVANVIRHVGLGTPTELTLSMSGTFLRIEVLDPDLRALPTLLAGALDSETGRGMRLVDAVTDRWGVLLKADRKVVWCELATGLADPEGHVVHASVDRAEALLGLYGQVVLSRSDASGDVARVDAPVGKTTAIEVIADMLCWADAHGFDVDEVVESAELRCESELRTRSG
ncbi:ATP-binding protein [Streptomyces sp. NPDC102340]|uniref:ATP-binding protein n=1 Tax=unclassified Streptomyces TaxID=2593676 RepID=UPI00382C413B